MTISGVALLILLCCYVISCFKERQVQQTINDTMILPEITIEQRLIQKNQYSRPGISLKRVKGIVVHYTANPQSDAMDNRNYFNNLAQENIGRENPTYASSHFIIGLDGKIVQCIPLGEIAYASNNRNSDTIAIECCHKDSSGKFTKMTYKALVELLVYLCVRYDLDEEDVIRHYDVTGKACPLYFVEHEDKWEELKEDVRISLRTYKE